MADADTRSPHSEEEIADFRQATKPAELRVTSRAALRRLMQDLTDACEVARIDALRQMTTRARDERKSDGTGRKHSFADLFAALRRVHKELKRRGEDVDVDRRSAQAATAAPIKGSTDSLHHIPATAPDVYAFRIRGKLAVDDFAAMAETMNAAFEAWDTVSMLLILEEFEGRETGAGLDLEPLKSQFRSLSHVEKYAVVGPPTYARRMINVMDKIIPVNARTFDAAEEHRAWEFVGARPLSNTAG